MIALLILILGVVLYSWFEGQTEGLTWNAIQETENDNLFPSQYWCFASYYHYYRLMETFGILAIALGLYALLPRLLNGIIYAIGLILFGFLVYRISFAKARFQDEITPDWQWSVWIPFYGTLRVSYPKPIIVKVLGIIGLIATILTFYLIK